MKSKTLREQISRHREQLLWRIWNAAPRQAPYVLTVNLGQHVQAFPRNKEVGAESLTNVSMTTKKQNAAIKV